MRTLAVVKPDELDWAALAAELDEYGCALTPRLLTPDQCRELAALYDEPRHFRATIDMARYRFGAGQYRYFRYPLPEPVGALRAAFYPHLLPIARDWAARLGHPAPWPDDLEEWLARCHDAGQTRPTPILLRYGPGDWNALHRDLSGAGQAARSVSVEGGGGRRAGLVFPLQVVFGLDTDYTGGEFLLVEQRPRAQSRGMVTALKQGHALIFTTRDRPVRSSRDGRRPRSGTA